MREPRFEAVKLIGSLVGEGRRREGTGHGKEGEKNKKPASGESGESAPAERIIRLRRVLPVRKRESVGEAEDKRSDDHCAQCTLSHETSVNMPSLSDEVRRFCSAHGLRLNRDLGQHYLVDDAVLSAIIDAANVTRNDHVVEIGAGIGVLTRELRTRAKHVTAIELDPRVIPLLHRFTKVDGEDDSLTVIEGNALTTPLPSDPYMIVANIPYHITSPLLRHVFLESAVQPRSLTLLIQREVAEKICAVKDAGLLTILVGIFGTPRIVTRVPASSFLPPPKVESAVLHVDCFAEPRIRPSLLDRVFTLTKIAFGQKRKMLRNTLGSMAGGADAMAKTAIDPARRPQTLSIEEWAALAECLEHAG